MAKVGSAAAASLLLLLSQSQAALSPDALANLSLEQLSEVEITSVSRRAEPLSQAPASAYVITSDDIRRAGVVSLPEALRLAPNLQVDRIDTGQYAVSARGFNNAIGNKLLVLIDGRTVYAPFFSGVLWDMHDVMLEDVDRIEVISGPGGTLWGANAVNGVINVVTRPAGQTRGGLAVLAGGNRDATAALRFGGTLGADGSFRIYGKSWKQHNTSTSAGIAKTDEWKRGQVGFRADWVDANGGFTLQGDALEGRTADRGFFGPFDLGSLDVSQSNLLGRWVRRYADGSDVRVQAYYSHSEREDALLYQPEEEIFDVEFQHGLPLGEHHLLWGGGYRRANDHIRPGVFFGFDPARSTVNWANLFAQDRLPLGEQLTLTVGVRLEHNSFTGTEVLPNARLAWQMSEEQFVWTAVSRAVRAPARLDRDLRLPPDPPFLIAGGPDFESEVTNVVEIGYRARPSPDLSFSITGFYQHWDRLRSGQPPPEARVQNMIHGNTSGVEAWASWQVADAWRLSGGATTLDKDLRLRSGSTDPVGPRELGNDPHHQWNLRSAFDLPYRQELDVMLRHVDALPDPDVPAYTAVDLRYGWRVNDAVAISFTIQNLLDRRHPEFGSAPDRSEIERTTRLQVEMSL